ncbi:MAG: hypothetical protein Q9227_000841 [Pyrenula ochraceoflavens]
MRAIFCCRAPSSSPSPEHPRNTALAPSGPSTVVSEIVHDDSGVLQDIFGRPSSIRGYRAASISTPHQSNTLLPGGKSTTQDIDKKTPKRLRALKVRLKLSNSRITRDDSKAADIRNENVEIFNQSQQSLPTELSPGLHDILASRSVSQGGYDSDAKNVDINKPPGPEQSENAGNVDISPEYIAKVLTSLDGSTTRTPSVGRTPVKHPIMTPPSLASSPHPTSPTEAKSDEGSEQTRRRVQSSPAVPSTPKKHSSRMVEIGNDESPRDTLRRLSHQTQTSNPSGKLESKAPRLPSLDSAPQGWELSFSAPRRLSSVHRTPERNRAASAERPLKVEESTGTHRPSMTSTKGDQRISVISNLDDSLVAQMNSFWSSASPQKLSVEAKPSGVPEVTALTPSKKVNEDSGNDVTSKSNPTGKASIVDRAIPNFSSGTNADSDPDTASVHLFNMRISQRLASNSMNPVRSPSVSNHGTRSQTRQGSISSVRNPLSACVPGVAVANHRRELSNASSVNSHKKVHRLWKDHKQIVDDSSSVYTGREPPGSDGEVTRPHSIDHGGPSRGSANTGAQHEWLKPLNVNHTETISDLSNPGESSWLRRNTTETFRSSTESYRAREIEAAEQRHGRNQRLSSTPKESKFVEDFSVGRPGTGSVAGMTRSQVNLPGTSQESTVLKSDLGASNATLSHLSSTSRLALPRENQETAAEVWERTLRATRAERELGSGRPWASTLSIPEWDYQKRISSVAPGETSAANSSLFLKPKKSMGSALNSMKSSIRRTPPEKWAQFPSHTRSDRNQHAGLNDQIEVRDFSDPILDTPLPQAHPRTQSTTGKLTWRLHKRKKSRSMTFTRLSAKNFLRQYTGLFRSQSSDLRRLRTGHRSSISAGGVVEYPELEMIPGFYHDSSLGRATDGSSEEQLSMQRYPYYFGSAAAKSLPRGRENRESSRIGLLSREDSTLTEDWAKRISELPSIEPGVMLPRRASRSTPNIVSTGYSSEFGESSGGRLSGNATTWSKMYADCLGSAGGGGGGGSLLPSSPSGTRTAKSATDDYVSVTFSDQDLRSTAGDHGGGGGCAGNGGEKGGRLVLSELRNSTVDFREVMKREEDKAREGLMRAVEGFGQGDGSGEKAADRDRGVDVVDPRGEMRVGKKEAC